MDGKLLQLQMELQIFLVQCNVQLPKCCPVASRERNQLIHSQENPNKGTGFSVDSYIVICIVKGGVVFSHSFITSLCDSILLWCVTKLASDI